MDALPDAVPEPLRRRALQAATWLKEQHEAGRTVTVVHHIDADGVSAGAIAIGALQRAGIARRPLAAKSLNDVYLEEIKDGSPEALWFCDFGSTAYMHFPDTPKLVCDHHELVRDGTEEDFPHVNPLLDDLPGNSISGAGCAYLVAAALDPANIELLPVALVGAAGDLQERNGGFHGANLALQEAGIAAGLLEVRRDIGWYGIETRPLTKFLQYAREPEIPGLTNQRKAIPAFLSDANVNLRADGVERTWNDLDRDEQRRLRSAIVDRMLDVGVAPDVIDGLVRDIVYIEAEEPRTPMRELREFATLLNSTARYGEPTVGLMVAGGDRGSALTQAMGLLGGHRQNLAQAVQQLTSRGVIQRTGVQWVHMENSVQDTVVGIVCGMALDTPSVRNDKPLLGFAYTDDGQTKISSRAPQAIQGRVDLATAMREGAAAFGGQGGGHKGAAGATIPRADEEAFLALVDGIVAQQLGLDTRGTTPSRAGQQTLL